jgi:hypothetical protein
MGSGMLCGQAIEEGNSDCLLNVAVSIQIKECESFAGMN